MTSPTTASSLCPVCPARRPSTSDTATRPGRSWSARPTSQGGRSRWRPAPARPRAARGREAVRVGRTHGTAATYYGEFGDGTTRSRTAPARIGVGTDWAAIAAGDPHTGGRRSDGTLLTGAPTSTASWATVLRSQTANRLPSRWERSRSLGVVEQDDVAVVTLIVATGRPVAPIRVGDTVPRATGVRFEVLGIDALARTVAIRLGVQQRTLEEGQTLLDDSWAMMSAGSLHTIAIKQDGGLWAWGRNGSGQLGDGSTTDRHHPVQIGSDKDWAAAAAGVHFSLAVKADGRLYAWGQNSAGQLGLGELRRGHRRPRRSDTDNDWVAIAASGSHALALKADGGCTGGARTQRRSRVTEATRTSAVRSPSRPDTRGREIAAGPYNGCAVTSDGHLWTWGANSGGQLGDGTQNTQRSPVPVGPAQAGWPVAAATTIARLRVRLAVSGRGAATAVSATARPRTGCRPCGSVATPRWAAISQRRLLDARPADRRQPVGVGLQRGRARRRLRRLSRHAGPHRDRTWSKIAAGFDYRLAIKSDGTLWAWGNNTSGSSATARRPPGPTRCRSARDDWTTISAG